MTDRRRQHQRLRALVQVGDRVVGDTLSQGCSQLRLVIIGRGMFRRSGGGQVVGLVAFRRTDVGRRGVSGGLTQIAAEELSLV